MRARSENSGYVTTLAEGVEHASRLEQVGKRDLRPGDRVLVRTRNSLYSICALGEDQYLISGGWFDREGLSPVTITINGCSWGGSAIKSDALAVRGLFLEFGNRVTTTRIQHFRVIRREEETIH